MSDNIRLVRGPDPIGTRTYPDLRRYDVYRDDVLLGYVQSRRSESYRKVGRLRGGRIGSPKTWDAYNVTGVNVGLGYTRGDAVRALLARTPSPSVTKQSKPASPLPDANRQEPT